MSDDPHLDESLRWSNAGDVERLLGSTIGARVREYRQAMELTGTQLADDAGISKSMLSNIENARTSPSLSTLARLAVAMSLPVTAFFRGMEEERDAVFVPAGTGADIKHRGAGGVGHRYQMLGSMRGPNRLLEPVLITLSEPSEVFPLFQHEGVEMLYILEGTLEYGFGTARYVLAPGDTLQFDGDVPHGPSELLTLPIQFLSIKAYGQAP